MTEYLLRLCLFLPLISLWRCRYEVICASGFQMVQTSVSFMFIRAILHIMNLLGEKMGEGFRHQTCRYLANCQTLVTLNLQLALLDNLLSVSGLLCLSLHAAVAWDHLWCCFLHLLLALPPQREYPIWNGYPWFALMSCEHHAQAFYE